MNEEFFTMIEQKATQSAMASKWQKKATSFFENFSYLNVDVLIEDQISKLTHVGVSSITQSSEMIAKMTSETMSMIDSQLKTIIKDVGEITTMFEHLEKTLNKKNGFFSFSNSSPFDNFVTLFQSQQDSIRQKINALNFKEHDLSSVKNQLENNIEKLTDVYALLQRDLDVINLAEKKLPYHSNELIVKIYNQYNLEILGIKTDLLTHQQIIYQKYAGIQILLQNVFNCHRNIKHISQVTHNVLMNVAELQQIMSLSQVVVSGKENASLVKLRNTLTLVTTDLKLIAAQPFSAFKIS